MIEVQHLTKSYQHIRPYRHIRAVDDLSFTVRPGAVTAFLGPNGAGKSSTLRMMLDLDRPSAGRVRFDARRYRDLPVPLREVGALLETNASNGFRTAYHHLLWLARSNGIAVGRVREVLARVGLEAVADRWTRTFSLGMRQRLGLAAALLGDPPVLLLDEPSNGLDPEGIRWLRRLLRSLADEGRTVLVSSHLMAEMALAADHLLVISAGRLVTDAPLADVLRDEPSGSLEDAFLRLTGPAADPSTGARG